MRRVGESLRKASEDRDQDERREPARWLYQSLHLRCPQKSWKESQQGKGRPDETRPEFSEHFKKTFKQHSALSPDNFNNHQNYPFLKLPFLEGLNEEFVILAEQHKLNWPTMHANKLAVLADELSKTIQEKDRRKLLKS